MIRSDIALQGCGTKRQRIGSCPRARKRLQTISHCSQPFARAPAHLVRASSQPSLTCSRYTDPLGSNQLQRDSIDSTPQWDATENHTSWRPEVDGSLPWRFKVHQRGPGGHPVLGESYRGRKKLGAGSAGFALARPAPSDAVKVNRDGSPGCADRDIQRPMPPATGPRRWSALRPPPA